MLIISFKCINLPADNSYKISTKLNKTIVVYLRTLGSEKWLAGSGDALIPKGGTSTGWAGNLYQESKKE